MILRVVCQLHLFFLSQQHTGAWSNSWSDRLMVGGLRLEYLVESDQRTYKVGSQQSQLLCLRLALRE